MALTGVVVVVVTFLLNVLQIIYGSNSVSPMDTHPNIMLIAISTFLLYCFACYHEQYVTSIFRSSSWPVHLIYTNFRKFLGFISMVSLGSIIFSISCTSLAFVHLLSALFFSGKSVLNLIRHRNSLAMKSMEEVKFPFGEILDVEVGLGTHYVILDILPNFGMGEAKDGPNPESPKKVILDKKSYKELVFQESRVSLLENELQRKYKEKECCSRSTVRGYKAKAKLGGEVIAKKRRRALPDHKGIVINGVENSDGIVTKLGFPQDNQMASTKGKSKIMGENLFNNNGLWSQEAIAALEKGKYMKKKLGKVVLNLEDNVIENVLLAEWSEKATEDQHGIMPGAKKKSQLEETSGSGVK